VLKIIILNVDHTYFNHKGLSMKYLKSAVRATTTLGVLSLAMSASANIYVPFYPVVEVHGSKGENSSSSLAAAAIMGEKGYSNTYNGVVAPTLTSPPPAGWEDAIINGCAFKTRIAYPTSLWPAICNPVGMAQTLQALDPGANWIVGTDPNTSSGKATILNWIFSSVYTYHSPAVVPLFGQADHFVAIHRFDATIVKVTGNSTTFVINSLSFYDGGSFGLDPANPLKDSGLHPYYSGLQTFSGSTFASSYSSVVAGIPSSDLFYNQFLLLFDPPGGQPSLDGTTSYVDATGIEPHGAMNEAKAQNRLWDALVAAGINNDPATWDPLSGAVAGPAVLVNGVFPDGSPWNYYLVPVLKDASTAVAFAQLSADNGSFQHIQVLDSPVPYAPVTQTQAAQLASGVLATGDRLTTGGKLTWNPLSDPVLARSPNAPYYEFGVIDANGKRTTARVMLPNGTAVHGH
jgi:hypothetical protein